MATGGVPTLARMVLRRRSRGDSWQLFRPHGAHMRMREDAGMTNWVRLWEDMPTDPKWRVIAKRSSRPISEVISVFIFMMTNAGASGERGSLSGWDDEDIAAALDMEGEDVSSIREAMQGKTLEGDHLTGWEKRQPKREDQSTQRVREYRERKAEESKRGETHRNAPEEKRIDTDTDITSSLRSDVSAPAREPKPIEILSKCLSKKTAADVIAHRKALKKPLTPRAAELLANSLAESGDAERAAATMIERGWQGYNSDWAGASPNARAGPPARKEKRNPVFQAYEEIMAERYGPGTEETCEQPADIFEGETIELAANETAAGRSTPVANGFARDHAATDGQRLRHEGDASDLRATARRFAG